MHSVSCNLNWGPLQVSVDVYL